MFCWAMRQHCKRLAESQRTGRAKAKANKEGSSSVTGDETKNTEALAQHGFCLAVSRCF